ATLTSVIYTLSLHDALPIFSSYTLLFYVGSALAADPAAPRAEYITNHGVLSDLLKSDEFKKVFQDPKLPLKGLYPGVSLKSVRRSEEHTSELQSRSDLVCRL